MPARQVFLTSGRSRKLRLGSQTVELQHAPPWQLLYPGQAAAIARMLSIFPELEARPAQPGRALSGGQKQMVCMVQALLARPTLLVVDELSLGLTPLVIKRLANVVKQVANDGIGVLLIEQFTTLALSLAARACVLQRGRMAWSGRAQTLREQPDILHSSYLG